MFAGIGLALLANAGWILVHPSVSILNSASLLTILSIFLTALLVGLMAGYPFIKKRAGTLLYKFPVFKAGNFQDLATAGMFLILMIFTIIRSGFSRDTIAELVFYVSVVFYFASPFFGKVELRQNGILETYSPSFDGKTCCRTDGSARMKAI